MDARFAADDFYRAGGARSDVLDYVEGEREASVVVADTLWDLAELGYLEEKAVRRCKIIWQNGSSSLNRALRIFLPPSWRDTAAVDQP
ncbi:MAG: hypothetical protein CM15mP120_17340 [Pseudomonadota bacterium]|nr:MAG: hypothetical protein CM15mP120_17340 [Pseudomonadota bacterium]